VDYLGVIRVELPSGRVGRFLAGHDGAAHPINGNTVFIQACGGGGAGRVAMADERGTVTRLLTPCSSEVPNPSDYSSTYWEKPVLSFDGTRVAVEGHYRSDEIGGGEEFYVAVYDMDTNQLGQSPGWAPAWTPDGRLVFGAADGLYLADAALDDPVRVDGGQLIGAVYGPKVHPAGDRVLFEYNQRIWQIGLDGSDLEEVAFGSARFSSPAYSPDGTAIAFIASESELDALLYLKNIAGDEYYPLDIRDQLSTSGVPGGPITWTSGLP
jgi:Tol biopolymer transport system component